MHCGSGQLMLRGPGPGRGGRRRRVLVLGILSLCKDSEEAPSVVLPLDRLQHPTYPRVLVLGGFPSTGGIACTLS